jgi:hypothetical protein
MNWLKKIFTGGIGQAAEQIGNVVADISEKHLGKKELKLELEKILAAQATQQFQAAAVEIQAKERILVAELQQGDNYTKRARPSIIYVGLIGAIVDGIGAIDFTMPADFWYIWGGVCSVYVVGRSVQLSKVNGVAGKVAGMITGHKSSLLND